MAIITSFSLWSSCSFSCSVSYGVGKTISWVVTGRDGYADFYKKDITFQVLGPVGDIVEEWKLKGAWIQDANFNDLAFNSNDPADISLTLRYDYAILQF